MRMSRLSHSIQRGFTIVELLIVVTVIGILAAIVIVSYNGITNSANDSSVFSDLSTFAKKLQIEKATSGRYPYPPSATTDVHISKGSYRHQNNLYYCYNAATDEYAVQARSVSGSYYKIVDGVASSGVGAYGYSGEFTCDLIDPSVTWGSGTAALGYDMASSTWATWAQD